MPLLSALSSRSLTGIGITRKAEWILSAATYTGKSFSVATQDTSPAGISFKKDGTVMYIAGRANASVRQYTLSTPWDVSTASFANKSINVSAQLSSLNSVEFRDNGITMYVVGWFTPSIFQYTLSTAWDVSTATYSGTSYSYSSAGGIGSSAYGFRFSSTGSNFYINGDNDTIFQFNLSTPWNVGTASYANKSKMVGVSGNLNPTGIDFKYDGTIMFVQDTTAGNNRQITAWAMSTPWDVSTATESATNKFSVGTQDPNPYDFYMRYDGLGFYVVGPNNDRVYQYSMGAFSQPAYTYFSVVLSAVPSSTRAFTVAQSTSLGLFTTDGITWTETTLPSSGIWLDSNYNPASAGRACALRWGAAAYSTDYGQTWLAATGMGGGDGSVNSLAPVTSTVWITVGSFPTTSNYYRSTDNGQTWTVQNFGSTLNGQAVAGAGAGLAVIVTGSLTYYTTTDGLAFTTRTFPSNFEGSASGWNEIEYVNGLYIAMRSVQNGRYIMTSSDGINWTVRDVSVGVFTATSFRDISFGGAEPGTWLIVTDQSDIYFTSTDLVTWTRRLLPASRRWSGIAWINNRWVAIVDGTNVKATSTDGVNWIESDLTLTNRRWMDLTEVR